MLFSLQYVDNGHNRVSSALARKQNQNLVLNLLDAFILLASKEKIRGFNLPDYVSVLVDIAGAVMRAEVVEEFGNRARYFNTFGGNPVSCAAGAAVLRVIERDRLVENARQIGAHLRAGLQTLAARHESLGDIRGAGLFIGVEIVTDRHSKQPDGNMATWIVNGLRRKRVLIGASGPYANNLKIRPPLICTKQNADTLLTALDEVLAER